MFGLVAVAATLSQFGWSAGAADIPFTLSDEKTANGARVATLSFTDASVPRKALLVRPLQECAPHACAGILFVHWLEPEAPNSNPAEFLAEAETLAQEGVISVLPETMWTDKEWFNKRNPDDDFAASARQVKDLRIALDTLAQMTGVDPQRLGYVGHDFGMMFGAILAGSDSRLRAVALQAGTTQLSDWFLLGRKLDAPAREAVVERLRPLAPETCIKGFHGALLLQFGRTDPYVPLEKAWAFALAANDPKDVRFYDCGHAMNAAAQTERVAWLRTELLLKAP
jgi:dienelactone hydrolase